ncbi:MULTISPECIES: DNA-3-methyladenine glycosylase I [unclassified Thauera]|uniref:DNA-3-methyladenine glycosylase I n=1 Tax=unclassified Thauera TaxID=2609274 RepID=UPI0002CF798B|nr:MULTISPECIES: DNA-3-methyladenine glycosylase I [unclassified Thauera]ENO92522.1 DNA-3-methyladenine glycosylase I [Thauera sp. 28]WBL62634.1 DNA-3-methyladenine glycosylase I [Thauera sp. WB-2]HNR59757.1 DNA-3-methyladenine glycosylase I [Thauera sp.]HNS94113.1 DNA-3-methyladenine glycosylase I [Thauera sp.]
MTERCAWCGNDPMYVAYHDAEWGVPSHDDRHLFEMLVLEGAQAGLSWITILRKREHYRRVFADFDAERVARYTDDDVMRLLADPGIVRNRLKVASAIANARAVLDARERFGSLDALVWQFVDGVPRNDVRRSLADVPAETAASRAMSRELKRLGFRFVGPTVCYAFMQAVGMVNDHVEGCFRQREIAAGCSIT